ncbi:hypothetical protein GN277_17945 [Lachnospiraceae bacterium WCA-9-b2]|uniref:Uncharacterized protein n=1 Tax=Sporofaciens musculi TaxID=2681861 RepID=A0A7X3SK40_9FIRM|nr:hypothetical protein [Sporofaciens musculi]MXP77188.1 hypothetical protein [Sporofaciens musculi]
MEKLAYEFRDFKENIPAIIKNKLNDMIIRSINIYLMNNIIEGCIPTAEYLLLNASISWT